MGMMDESALNEKTLHHTWDILWVDLDAWSVMI
jgi:hypothetical protein